MRLMGKFGGIASVLILIVCGSARMARADPISLTFTTLDVPGAIYTRPAAINDAGAIVGSYITSAGTIADTVWHGFLYSGGTFTTIDVPPNPPGLGPGSTMLNGINNAGQIVGVVSEAGLSNPHAFELDGNRLTVLDLPGHDNGGANGINNRGQIVGSYYLRRCDGSRIS